MRTPPESHWELRSSTCPVCQERAARFIGYRGGWAHHRGAGIAVPLVRCSGCDLVYPNPTPFPRDHSHYESADEYFAGSALGEEKVDGNRALLEEAQARLGRPPGLMLDIGCGCGESLRAAESLGWTATGVEPSEAFAQVGQRELGVTIYVGAVEDAGFASQSFDLVLLSGVLEHVYDPLALLCEARRLLRTNGLLYIDVPNERSLYNRLGRVYCRVRGRDWSVCLAPTFPPYHVVGFSPNSLRFSLERARLRPLSLRTYPLAFCELSDTPGRLDMIARIIEAASRITHSSAGLLAWATPA